MLGTVLPLLSITLLRLLVNLPGRKSPHRGPVLGGDIAKFTSKFHLVKVMVLLITYVPLPVCKGPVLVTPSPYYLQHHYLFVKGQFS